jgi:hypothetical protein
MAIKINEVGLFGFGVEHYGNTKHTRMGSPLDWRAAFSNKDGRNDQLARGVESCTWWCRLGYSHFGGPGVIADTDDNYDLMQRETYRVQSHNGWERLDTTRAAGRARQRASMLHLFASKR